MSRSQGFGPFWPELSKGWWTAASVQRLGSVRSWFWTQVVLLRPPAERHRGIQHQHLPRRRVEGVEPAAALAGPVTEVGKIPVGVGLTVVVIAGQRLDARAQPSEIGVEAAPELVGRAVHIGQIPEHQDIARQVGQELSHLSHTRGAAPAGIADRVDRRGAVANGDCRGLGIDGRGGRITAGRASGRSTDGRLGRRLRTQPRARSVTPRTMTMPEHTRPPTSDRASGGSRVTS